MSNTYRTIIVDDERLARLKLVQLLEKYSNIEISGEANDVPSAVELITKINPDLIFLDIQMPKQSGFDLLGQIEIHGKIVFVTAYDEYAVRAFEVNALDYLMKPVSTERLDLLMKKIEGIPVKADHSKMLDYDDKLFVPGDKYMKFIDVKDILIIQALGNYSKIFSASGEFFMIYKSLREWNNRLPAKKFCQVHRGIIINIDYVIRVEKWFNYSYKAFIQGIDEPVKISKNYSGIFKEKFG